MINDSSIALASTKDKKTKLVVCFVFCSIKKREEAETVLVFTRMT